MLLEAFPGRLPTEIIDEIARLPVGFLEDALEAKAYRGVKAMVDAAQTAEARKQLPTTPLFALYREIEMEIAAEAMERRSG